MLNFRYFLTLVSLILLSTVCCSKTINEGVSEDRLNIILNDKNFYIMEPPLLAMLKVEDLTRRPHYVQIFLALRSEEMTAEIGEYEPKLRDRIVHLLGQKTYSYLSTLRGRRLIVFEILKAIQQVMWEETGDPTVTDVEVIELIVE